MKRSLTNTFKLTSILVLIGANFALAAHATSPTKPAAEGANMITINTYTVDNYQSHEQSKMYPKPADGMKQVIVTLPAKTNETGLKIEFEIGKWQMQDCNRARLAGSIDKHTVQGWGYSYYQVDTLTQGPSTLMACPEGSSKRAFVTTTQSLTIDYDSRLPKVFYIPQDAQLRYKVWQTTNQYHYSE
ncbi:serine protease inhibitor ecotin [Shewanella waksmanii]|uniref:serine protease inhibitor ecotin n=1 Tax=Shewanella waksmanii TaxID=213783 RepID=UPI00373565FA